MSSFESIIVFAAHPDDEVIGCGGSLAALAGSAAHCTIVYLTDGSKSHPNSADYPADDLASLREAEARDAITLLGIRAEQVFLRIGDGSLASLGTQERGVLVDAVEELIEVSRAEVVYAPWRRDPHDDHIATAAVVEEALARCALKPRLLMYSVWLGVRGSPSDEPRVGEVATSTTRLDDLLIVRKRNAILAHKSQASALITDDATAFRIGPELLAKWTMPVETFFTPVDLTRNASEAFA